MLRSIILIGVLFVLTACAMVTPAPEPTALPTPLPTWTPTSAPTRAPTATRVVPINPPPSAPSPPPTATQAKRITFAAGATSATIRADLVKNGVDRFVLKAEAGQTLTVQVTAPTQVLFSVSGANGDVLKSAGAGASGWSGVLRATQDYTIALNTADGNPASYTLLVTIPPPPTGAPQARRIVFAQGTSEATMHGNLSAGKSEHFVLRALASQTLNVTVASEPRDAVNVVIWGVDGVALVAASAGATKWNGRLPKSQDYFIDLRPRANQAAEYTLFVTVK